MLEAFCSLPLLIQCVIAGALGGILGFPIGFLMAKLYFWLREYLMRSGLRKLDSELVQYMENLSHGEDYQDTIR